MTESFTSRYSINSVLFTLPWHEESLPDPDDIVIGYINKIEETGLIVHILDYGGIEALMPLQELSRKKVSSIRSLFKEGDIRPLLVLRVDKDKGFIDLSNKYVNMAQDEISRLDKYALVIKIFYQWLFNKDKINIDNWRNTLSNSVWLYSKSEIYDIITDIKMNITDIKTMFPNLITLFTDTDITKLKKIIDEYITYSVKLYVSINLIVWGINAISTIKTILSEIKNELGDESELVKTTAPNYVFVLKSNNKNYLVSLNNTLKETLEEKLKKYTDIKFNINIELKEFN
jgi:translation initiation factor 2 subunit 1